MDINFDTEKGVFNYRVAAVIENNGKFLVAEHSNKDYLSLIGGRTKIGESSIETIKREVLEETGYQVSETKVMGILENFFTSSYDNKAYHEILILVKVDFEDQTVNNQEKVECLDKKDISFTWKNIDELKQKNLKPTCVTNYLTETNLFHVINKD